MLRRKLKHRKEKGVAGAKHGGEMSGQEFRQQALRVPRTGAFLAM